MMMMMMDVLAQRLGTSETELRRGQEREERTRAELDKLKGQHHGTIIAQVYY